MDVVSLFTYRTSKDCAWTDADHSIKKFVDALKGRPVRGYGHILSSGWNLNAVVKSKSGSEWCGW